MNQDYVLRAFIAWNLGDAREELAQIIETINPHTEIDEAKFKSRMAHLYSHLNTAWNARNTAVGDTESANAEQLQSWSRFPSDLDPFP